MEEANQDRVPVTIITGFLGAGKTTLLNYILQNKGTKNISVIENEFGEVNIDSELVADNLLEKEDLVSLENGCVCCSLRKDIVKALAEIERRATERARRVDQVILETTGLADPAPVAFTFFTNPWVAARFKLDSILCVVDSRYILQHLDDRPNSRGINEVVQQLAFADTILLNKTDLVRPSECEAVKGVVRGINASARILEGRLNAEGHRPPVGQLLGANAFSVNKALQVDPHFLDSDSGSDEMGDSADGSSDEADDDSSATSADGATPPAPAPAPARPADDSVACSSGSAGTGVWQSTQESKRQHVGNGACADCADACPRPQAPEPMAAPPTRMGADREPKRRRKQLHDLCGVASVGIVARGALDEYRFNMFMRDLLQEKSKDIFRCKGVLAVHGYGDRKFVFQGVHDTICYGPSERPWLADEPRINQIVFIGRGLDRRALMEGFRTCVWQPLPPGWHQAHDPITNQQYYFHPASGAKTWARPIVALAPGAPNPVTATRVVSTEQPLRLQRLQGSSRRRRVGGTAGGSGASGSALGTPEDGSAAVSSADASAATAAGTASATAAVSGADDMDL